MCCNSSPRQDAPYSPGSRTGHARSTSTATTDSTATSALRVTSCPPAQDSDAPAHIASTRPCNLPNVGKVSLRRSSSMARTRLSSRSSAPEPGSRSGSETGRCTTTTWSNGRTPPAPSTSPDAHTSCSAPSFTAPATSTRVTTRVHGTGPNAKGRMVLDRRQRGSPRPALGNGGLHKRRLDARRRIGDPGRTTVPGAPSGGGGRDNDRTPRREPSPRRRQSHNTPGQRRSRRRRCWPRSDGLASAEA